MIKKGKRGLSYIESEFEKKGTGTKDHIDTESANPKQVVYKS